MDVLITLLIMVLCLLAEGFFSGSEIGVVSADQMKLRHEAANGSRGAQLALSMLKKPEWLLSTTLVGTNIAVVTNTTMATALMIELFGDRAGWLAIVVAAPLIWIFGEIVPKSVFQQRADTITPIVIFPLKVASYLFWPILIVFSLLTRLLTRVFGGMGESPFTLREQLITMLEMPATKGDIDASEGDMIRRLFTFSETTIEDIMEEVVEDIEDEYDAKEKPTQWIRKLSDHEYLVSARIEIDALEEKLGVRLPEGNYLTLAGYLLGKARTIPSAGTVIDAGELTFIVERATPQTIQEVRVRLS